MSEEVWPGMGERIRQRIRELGHRSVEKFTQAHRDSDYSLGLVYKWIRGEVAPSRSSVLRLAADLECEPAYLFFGTPKPVLRRKALPIGVGVASENPLPVAKRRMFKKNHTKGGVSARRGEALC